MKKAISVILILAVVVIGAMHGHYTYLSSRRLIPDNVGFLSYLAGNYHLLSEKPGGVNVARGPERPATAGEPGKDTRSQPPEKKETPPAVEKIKPPKEIVELQDVPGLLKEGRELYSKGDYKAANTKYKKALDILARARRQSSPQYEEAKKYSMRSHVFGNLMTNIPMLELSDGKDLSSIELDTGNTIVARILKEDSSGVTVQQNGGIQATFSEDQVVDIKPLSEAKYRRGLKQEFRQRLGKVDSKLYFDIFGVALYAIQNKLHDEVTPILEQTFNLSGSELVLQTFYTGSDVNELVVQLLDSFDKMQEAREYRRQHELAQKPPEHESPPGPEPVRTPEHELVEPEPVRPTIPASLEEALQLADRYFAAGQKFANYATRNPSKRLHFGKKADRELEKARDILNPLLDKYPDNRDVSSRLQDLYGLIQYVKHNLLGF